MIIPIRCFTCGKVVANIYEKYLELIKGMSKNETLNKLNIDRYCCRRMFLTQVDVIDEMLE